MQRIEIIQDERGFTVIARDRYADRLGADECLALVASLIITAKLQRWLKTAEQNGARLLPPPDQFRYPTSARSMLLERKPGSVDRHGFTTVWESRRLITWEVIRGLPF